VLSGGTLIDFEGLANGTLVDTQYAGVTFGQDAGGGRPQIDQFPWLFGYGSSSGDHVLTGSSEGGPHLRHHRRHHGQFQQRQERG
jgi:hypothetical protein